MSVRMIWIVYLDSGTAGKVLYSRKFPTVERRVQKAHGKHFVPIPDVEEFCSNLLIRLGVLQASEFVEWRDKANKQVQLPVVDVKTQQGYLWPITVMEQRGLIFACLSEVDAPYSLDSLPFLSKVPSVSVAFAVLEGLIGYVESLQFSETEISNSLTAVDNYLSISMPFGHPYDCEHFTANALLSLKDQPLLLETKQKIPGWKPVPFKGKSCAEFYIYESVRCIQWDQPGYQGHCDVYGKIQVKAELEGIETDISVLLHSSQSDVSLQMESLVQHPCVKSVQQLTTSTGSQGSRKIRFTPPLHSFDLCHYIGSAKIIPPILGVYKARGEKKIELLLQLKLCSEILNNFKYCEARIPFFNRGVIKTLELCKPSWGLLQMSDDKSALVWKIGQKFPPRSLEVSLTTTVIFDETIPSVSKDSFCTGLNSYVQVKFLMPNTTLTGCTVDLKTLQTSPPYKIRSSAVKELKSGEYKIWNAYGDVPYSSFDGSTT